MHPDLSRACAAVADRYNQTRALSVRDDRRHGDSGIRRPVTDATVLNFLGSLPPEQLRALLGIDDKVASLSADQTIAALGQVQGTRALRRRGVPDATIRRALDRAFSTTGDDTTRRNAVERVMRIAAQD